VRRSCVSSMPGIKLSTGLIAFFTNQGKIPVAIEDVSLILNYGKEAKIEDATSWIFEGEVTSRDIGSLTVDKVKMRNGTTFAMYDAMTTSVNNKSFGSPAFLVDGNNIALLQMSFATTPIDTNIDSTIVQSFAIRYFNQNGRERLAIIPLDTMQLVRGAYII